jgi:hypothetical protein
MVEKRTLIRPSNKMVDSKQYFQWRIVLPPNFVTRAKFKEGQKLKITAKKGKICLG